MVDLMTYRARIGTFAGVKALPGVLRRSRIVTRKLKKRRQPIKDLNLKIFLVLEAMFLLVCVCASSYRIPSTDVVGGNNYHSTDKHTVIGMVSNGSLAHRVIYQTSISLDDQQGQYMMKWKPDMASYTLPALSPVHVPGSTPLDFVLLLTMTSRTQMYLTPACKMTISTHLDTSFISRLTHADFSRLSAVAKFSQLQSPRVPAINRSTMTKLFPFPSAMVNHISLQSTYTPITRRRTHTNLSDLVMAENLLYQNSSTQQAMVGSTDSDVYNLSLVSTCRNLYTFFLSNMITCENCDTLLLEIPNMAVQIMYLPFVSGIHTSVLNASLILRLLRLDSPTISTMVAGSGTCDYLLGNRGAHSYNGNPGREGSPASSNTRKEIISEQDSIKIIEVSNVIVICEGCTWNDFTGQLIYSELLSISDIHNIKITVSFSEYSKCTAMFSKNEDRIIYIVSSEDGAGNFNPRDGVGKDNVGTLILKTVKEGGDRDLPDDGTKITLPLQLQFKHCTETGKFSTESENIRQNQILEESEINRFDPLEHTIERASSNEALVENCSKHESYCINTEATEFSQNHIRTKSRGNILTDEAICLNSGGKNNDVNKSKSNLKHSEKLNEKDSGESDLQGHVKSCRSRNINGIAFIYIIIIYLEEFKCAVTEILMLRAGEVRKTCKLLKKNVLPASTISAKKIVERLSLPKHKRSEYLPCPDTSNVIAYPLGADLRSFMANTGKSKEQMLDNQWIRLSTFTGFPANSPVSTMRLSDAGFYYETVGTDEVTCFKCGVKHKGWAANDIPVLVHKSISPSCEFIKNKSAPSVSEYGFDNSSHVQQRTENVIPITEPQTSYSQTTGSVSGASGGPGDLHQLPSRLQAVELESSSTQQNAETELEMSRPVVAGSKPPEISETAAGNPANFAFTQQNSATSDKMSGSIAQSYSGNNSGNARAAAPVANVPTTTQTTATSDATTKSKYPMYALYASRLQTYGGFPKDLNQKPEELSKAGFFYEGKNDNVRCFYCGGGLRDWEPEDDPWIEHARWYQKCEYLRKNKGDEFVRLVHNGQYELLRRELQKKKEAERRKTEVMQLPAVVSVIEMGYSENLVKRAYHRYTSENENTSVTADVLLQMVWQLEEEGENNLDLGNETTTVERERSYTETSERPSFQASAEETQVQATSVVSQSQAEEQIGPETVEELEQENKILKEQQMCKICMEEEVAIVFLPCGHMVTCVSCAAAMRHCPLCRTFIRGTVKAIVC